jgi:two-component system sensor histidine kinase KdpD
LPGVGVGLAVCRAIVHAHGGSIVARNRSGGAEVRLSLPLGAAPAVPPEAMEPPAPGVATPIEQPDVGHG